MIKEYTDEELNKRRHEVEVMRNDRTLKGNALLVGVPLVLSISLSEACSDAVACGCGGRGEVETTDI